MEAIVTHLVIVSAQLDGLDLTVKMVISLPAGKLYTCTVPPQSLLMQGVVQQAELKGA